MPERVNNIPQMSDEQRNTVMNLMETPSIMDVASTEMTEVQEEQLRSLAEAKAESTKETVADIVGAQSVPSFRFTKPRPVVRDYHINRNDPCPCGSGLKYKKCCLKTGTYESTHTI